MGILVSKVNMSWPGEPLALTAVRLYGKFLAALLPNRTQFIAGDTCVSTYDSANMPEACRVVANPRIFASESFSLWVERRVSHDDVTEDDSKTDPKRGYDTVSFEHLGYRDSRATKTIIDEYRQRTEKMARRQYV